MVDSSEYTQNTLSEKRALGSYQAISFSLMSAGYV